MIHTPDHAAMIFMVAVGPAMVVISLMFIVRPVGGHRQSRPSDSSSFTFIYSVCILLAAYLLGVMLLEDQIDLSQSVITLLTLALFLILILPILVPLVLIFYSDSSSPEEEPLLSEAGQKEDQGRSGQASSSGEVILLSEVEDEKPKDVDLLPASERRKRIAQLQSKLFHAAAEGAVRVKRRRGPHRGENFTLMQALIKADFWLIFVSLLLGSGSGLTVIDNLGQISESLGYGEPHIFVCMISIWNFLGRVGGGYFSEIIVRYVSVSIQDHHHQNYHHCYSNDQIHDHHLYHCCCLHHRGCHDHHDHHLPCHHCHHHDYHGRHSESTILIL